MVTVKRTRNQTEVRNMKPTIDQIIAYKHRAESALDGFNRVKAQMDELVGWSETGFFIPECNADEHDELSAEFDRLYEEYKESRADFEAAVFRFTYGCVKSAMSMNHLFNSDDALVVSFISIF